MSIDNYDIGPLLGRGGFATVYQAINKETKENVAIKIIKKDEMIKNNLKNRIKNEIKIHDSINNHNNIIKLIDYFEDNANIYMILELCQYGNFYQYIKTHGILKEIEIKHVINQLLIAIQYLHNNNIVHRDLKLSNILIHSYTHTTPNNNTTNTNTSNKNTTDNTRNILLNIKLCDFGLAAKIQNEDEEHYTICGTINYIAPEIVTQQAHGYPVDIWSVGCLYYRYGTL